MGSIAENAVLFSSYGLIFRSLVPVSDSLGRVITGSSIAGLFSGALVSVILTPVELVKCRMQVSGESGRQKYRSTLHCLQSIFKHEGGIKGFFRGAFAPTCLRESIGCAAWFSIYEGLVYHWMKRMILPKTKKGEKEPDRLQTLGACRLLLAGALGGLGFNLIMFPADVIKSRIQVEGSAEKAMVIARQLVAAEGIRGLYRGCAITCVRSIPTSACMFLSYEMTMKFMAPSKQL